MVLANMTHYNYPQQIGVKIHIKRDYLMMNFDFDE